MQLAIFIVLYLSLLLDLKTFGPITSAYRFDMHQRKMPGAPELLDAPRWRLHGSTYQQITFGPIRFGHRYDHRSQFQFEPNGKHQHSEMFRSGAPHHFGSQSHEMRLRVERTTNDENRTLTTRTKTVKGEPFIILRFRLNRSASLIVAER